MNSFRNLGFSVFSVLFLSVIVMLASCSKKEVVQDEPLMSPTEEMEGGMMGSEGEAESSEMGSQAAMSNGLRTVYFEFDRYNLTQEARDSLQNNADWMKQNPTATIQIEGHCDERGTIEYNLALGERRANSVREYLANLGVEESRISTISYGEERAANPGHDEGAWAENRRSEFVILSQ